MKHPEGFELPIHKSLTERILLGGVPRELAILSLTVGGVLLFGTHSLLSIVLAFLFHVGAVAATKKDQMIYEVVRRAIKHKRFYDA